MLTWEGRLTRPGRRRWGARPGWAGEGLPLWRRPTRGRWPSRPGRRRREV